MSTGSQYVVAAYGVILFALVLYMVVVGLRSARLAREAELLALLVGRDASEGDSAVAASSDVEAVPDAAPHA